MIYTHIQISSAWAYAEWDKLEKKSSSTVSFSECIHQPVKEWKNIFHNDFEKIVFKIYPEIQQIKNSLYEQGALFASLSGSGSSVYGIFGKPVTISAEKSYRVFTAILD
jgi:4-diphosphocytidyl-2-C-methyl-D-erythritol kinase